jgi:A/G-specific adenine glycosylase
LRKWYQQHARTLPWRQTEDPYAIWVSEIMLQQTQVATAKAYFDRFVRAFPTVEALAKADRRDVLRLWEGLGYYRRATQLQRAAQILVERHGGQFPRDPQDVCNLPGIGRYTAGAVLSIAFGDRQPILEANTTRLFGRMLAYRGQPASAEGQRLLWAMAETVLPRRDVGSFNQALMELGSEVCLARTPQCDSCPVAPLCRARIRGLQASIPPARPKRPPEPVNEVAVIIRRRGRVLLVRCPEHGRWAGLWDFPRFGVRSRRTAALRRELAEKVRRQTGLIVNPGGHLKTIKHSVTRFRITLDCYEAEYVSDPDGKPAGTEMKWLRPAELDRYPLSTTGRTVSRLAAGLARRVAGGADRPCTTAAGKPGG